MTRAELRKWGRRLHLPATDRQLLAQYRQLVGHDPPADKAGWRRARMFARVQLEQGRLAERIPLNNPDPAPLECGGGGGNFFEARIQLSDEDWMRFYGQPRSEMDRALRVEFLASWTAWQRRNPARAAERGGQPPRMYPPA
jgi:hypothetical protein